MEFRLLGPLEVAEGKRRVSLGGLKQRAVLAHLLVEANHVVPTGVLIEEIWGDEPPAAARNSLQAYVSRLRKILGPDRIEGGALGYVLHAVSDEIDVLRFEELTRKGRRALTADPRVAADSLAEALELWRGAPFADVGEGVSLEAEAARLEELRLAAIEDRVAAELALGQHADVIPELESLVERYPLRERLWGQLMLALYRSGRQADALSAYGRARDVLAEELGIDPSPEVQRLQVQILNQDPALELLGQPIRGYQLLEQIGEGTFGVVHRAIQPQVGREVAVKVIHPHLADQPEFIRRFEAEAQLVARLEHPNIVPLYDYWREPGGAFLVMRWLRGGSLQRALADGPFEPARAALVVKDVAAALSAAHREGVVHRDVKPSNILLDQEGNAYLSDFGIAEELLAGEAADAARLFPYRSPEQRRGQPSTPRSDLYGLGAVLFEMLTGSPPTGPRPRRGARRSPRGLPTKLGAVVDRALADDPADRFADAMELAEAVGGAIGAAPRTSRQAPVAAAVNPYKGLKPFFEADAADFFGREEFVERLLGRMKERGPASRFLAVVGPSGSGKSSVVRAGLVPALRQGAVRGSGRWFVVEMFPGSDPLDALEEALSRIAPAISGDLLEDLRRDEQGLVRAAARVLPRDRSELVLVVDQFEELFTMVEDEDRRARFLSLLIAAVSAHRTRVRVVITLRADFYDRPLRYRGLAGLMRSRTETLIPMTPQEIERAISGPAMRLGVVSEPGLAARMVADVTDQPGGLPLLQYALTELFERRRESSLTIRAYNGIGGVTGALARSAEELYEGWDDVGRDACRQLFLRLVTLGEGTEDTRRLVRRSELASLDVDQAALDGVISALGAHRLVSFDRDPETREPTVEVAHEALLREWPRLAGWIEDGREDLRSERRLTDAARDWEEASRDPSFLLQGTRLEQMESWTTAPPVAVTASERAYLGSSLAQRDARRAEEEARAARERALERRSLRRLRSLVAALTVAALVAGGLSAFAFAQRSRASREARLATARELAAAARANLEVDPDLSINLALHAVETTRGPDGIVLREAEEALRRAVHGSRVELSLPGLFGATFSPDGSRFVTSDDEGEVTVWEMPSGEEIDTFELHSTRIIQVEFTPDGSRLVTTSEDGTAKLADAGTGQVIRTFSGHTASVYSMNLNRDGSLLATRSKDNSVMVWNLASGRRLQVLRHDSPLGVHFHPDGVRLAVGDGVARVWDVRSGDELLAVGSEVVDVRFSPDGTRLATADGDGMVRVWDARTGALRLMLSGHTSSVEAVDFSPDGSVLASGSLDGTVRVWDAATGRELLVLSGQGGAVEHVTFSPDGRLVAGAGTSGTTKVWDITPAGSRELVTLDAHDSPVFALRYSPDGARLVTAGLDGRVRVWDAAAGEEILGLTPGPTIDVRWSPDASRFATAGEDGWVRLWEADTGKRLLTLEGHRGPVSAAAFFPDGGRLATSSIDGTAKLWDLGTGREVLTFEGHAEDVFDVDVSPDGSRIATVSQDETVKIWDAASGTNLRDLRGHTNNVFGVAFSPDGALVASGSIDGTARVWDVAAGRELHTLEGHPGGVLDVAFSPDGTDLVTAGLEGTAKVWEVATGRELLTLTGHAAGVFRVSFSPDGSRLAVSGEDGTVRIYVLDVDELVDLALDRATRPLTDAECRQYLHVSACSEAV
ncbi:MAG: BTAD domain-containing putative transcriptional regulator [Actinomycetota bacterium]